MSPIRPLSHLSLTADHNATPGAATQTAWYTPQNVDHSVDLMPTGVARDMNSLLMSSPTAIWTAASDVVHKPVNGP